MGLKLRLLAAYLSKGWMTARRAGRRSRTRAEREQWDRTPGDISAMMLA
jgi:hypothetical protein